MGGGNGAGNRQGRRWPWLCLCLALAPAWGAAAPPLSGEPPFTRLEPDIEVYPQNFGLTQDAAGVVYVGNSEGVLIHDGSRWELLRLPNQDSVRALQATAGGRVYVGGYNLFGYLEHDATGRAVYHDLSGLFAALLDGEDFADIWDLLLTDEAVWFRALRHVFRYDPVSGQVRLWRHPGRFGRIQQDGDTLILQFRGEGLRRLEGDAWTPLPGTAGLDELIFDWIPWPGGGLLSLAADGRWWLLKDGQVRSHDAPAALGPSSDYVAGLLLPDGSLALTAADGRLVLYQPGSGRVRQFQLDSSFLGGVTQDRAGGLLVAGTGALFHVEWPSTWTRLGASRGIAGGLYAVEPWGERLLALTGAGVLGSRHGPGGRLRFEPQAYTRGEAWDLLALDEDSALLAESYAVLAIRGGEVQAVTPGTVYPRILHRSRFDPDLVYVGTESGLAVLRRAGPDWRLLMHDNSADHWVTSVVEIDARRLWLGTERGGLRRVELNAAHDAILHDEPIGEAAGLAYGPLPGISLLRTADGELLASNDTGLYRYTGERFERTDLDGLEALRGADDSLLLSQGPDGRLWAHSYREIYRQADGGGWQRENLAGIRQGALAQASFLPGGQALFSSDRALLIHEGGEGPGGHPPRVALRQVRLDGGGQRRRLPLNGGQWPAKDAATLELAFALPDFHGPGRLRFQTRLSGIEQAFSDWSDADSRSYLRLPPGDYAFELRGRDSQGRISTAPPYRFTLTPPWYASGAARLGLGLLGVLSLLLAGRAGVRYRTRRLAADKQRLEAQIAARTRELAEANARLEAMAHRDGLTGAANRHRLQFLLDQACQHGRESGTSIAAMIIDVDNFKSYNDTHGHLAGDELLQRLARFVAGEMRPHGIELARYGGDEFMLVLPGYDGEAAGDLATGLQAGLRQALAPVTVSIGAASITPEAADCTETLIDAADGALYDAKAAGRDRVAVAGGERGRQPGHRHPHPLGDS